MTKNAIRTACIAAVVLLSLFQASASAASVVARQQSIPLVLAEHSGCGALNNHRVQIIVNASAIDDCSTDGGGDESALCICSGGVLLPVAQVAPTATTSISGIVRLATDGESTGSDVIQASDARLDQIPPPNTRTIRVDPALTANGTTIFNTVKAAADYVATQSPGDSNEFQILVQGGGDFEELPFTIPDSTDVICQTGSGVYYAGNATTIKHSALTSGSFITMGNRSGLRNCIVSVAGTPVSERRAIDCVSNNTPCVVDHVGVVVNTAAGNVSDIGVRLWNDTGLYPVAHLYYVVIAFSGPNNTASVGLQVGARGFLVYDNGLIAGGGGSHGKGMEFDNDSPAYCQVKNVQVGSLYNPNEFAVDISDEGTGAVHLADVNYDTSAGAYVDHSQSRVRKLASVGTCDSTKLGVTVYDTSTNEFCGCGGASPAWAALDGSGTCD